MTRYGLLVVAALAALGFGSHGAWAFTVINQSNYANGGASGLAVANPDAVSPRTPATQTQPSSGLSFGFSGNAPGFSSNAPGYGGASAFDVTGSTYHDNLPTFPGQDNHLTPSENAGFLQYGILPRRY